MARLDAGMAVIAPYPELKFEGFKTHDYKGKGPASATVSCYWQVGTCAGICLFPAIFFGTYPLMDYLNAVTGWGMEMREALEAGARIQTLRHSFSIREGIKPSEIKLPPRMAGVPPKTEGPLEGITIDIDSLKSEYYEAMGWDAHEGFPTDATVERLGLKELIATHGK
jgi:aldehyde:ferredoxin oxidoreductase